MAHFKLVSFQRLSWFFTLSDPLFGFWAHFYMPPVKYRKKSIKFPEAEFYEQPFEKSFVEKNQLIFRQKTFIE